MKKSEIKIAFQEYITTRYTSEATLKIYDNIANKFISDRHPTDLYNLSKDYIKKYLISIKNNKSASSYNQYMSVIKILYREILKQPYKLKELKPIKVKRKLKILPKFKDVDSKLAQISNIKHRALIMTIISTGVRISELLNIKLKDVDSENNKILITNGKGNKSRFVPLTYDLLNLLRDYYKEYKPKKYLFEGCNGKYTKSSVNKVIKNKLDKFAHAHLYRHLFATYMINKGINHYKLKEILGHKDDKSTAWYYQYDNDNIEIDINPINELIMQVK